jgi:hypothetical protein
MKKVILAMVLILPFVFQSCKNDDDEKISLAGTEWICKFTLGESNLETYLKFPDGTRMQTTNYENGQQSGSPEQGTYTVSGSKIVITYHDGTTCSGTISGNTITIVFDEDPSSQFVFKKK